MNRSTFDAMLSQYKKPTIEGEGSVSWDKGARCVIPKVEIGGKGEQKTYSGKNLFNPESTFFIATLTYDQAYPPKYENGIFYPAGATGISNGQMICIRVKPGDVYTLSFELVSGAPTNGGIVGFAERGENGIGTGINYTLSTIPTSPWTFVIPAGVNYIGIQPLFGNTRYSVGVRDIMLVKKASNTNSPPGEYEPYTGGIPAPNPNYPIMPVFSEGTTVKSTNGSGFDGGTAVAPDLLAIPGTEYRDTWDAQTGKGVRRCAVIESYSGETINTPFLSSTGQLTEGAYVVYGIPDEPFQTEPQPLIQPPGIGQIIQTGGTLGNCPLTVKPVTHREGETL